MWTLLIVRIFSKFRPVLLIFWAILAGLAGCSSDNSSSDSSLPEMSSYEMEIFNLINQHRTSIGLKDLVFDGNIQVYAAEHSRNMAAKVVEFGHDGFDDRAAKIIQAIQAKSVAENVAWGQNSAEQLVQSWLDSPGHRKNIEGEFDRASLSAVKSSENRWFYTQMFAAL